jgi:hypothetical protein
MKISKEHILTRPIQDGDCGIVITADSNWKIFTTGDFDPNGLTPAQSVQMMTVLGLVSVLQDANLLTKQIEGISEIDMEIPLNG